MNNCSEILNPLFKFIGYKNLKKGILTTYSEQQIAKEWWADNFLVAVDHLESNLGKCKIKLGGSSKYLKFL